MPKTVAPILKRVWTALPIVLATFLLMLVTMPTNFGDTKWYARNLVAHERGDFHEDGSRLWEFGHLIERPVGYAVYRSLKPFGRSRGWSDYLTARASLLGISITCALILAGLLQSLARRAGASAVTAFFIALAAMAWNGPLTFAPSGTAYIPGLLFLTSALWLSLAGGHRWSLAVTTGAMLAISACF